MIGAFLLKQKKWVCVLYIIAVCITTVLGQLETVNYPLGNAIAEKLAKEGFQSIDITQRADTLVVGYENRVYRFEVLGLNQVMKITKATLTAYPNNFDKLIFVSKQANIPMISTEWKLRNQELDNLTVSREIKTTSLDQKMVESFNTSNFRAELVLRPYLTMELGNLRLEDQFIHLIDLRPKLNIYLWKGAHFTTEVILPISNEFKTQAPHWGEIRTRVISLTQQFRLPRKTFVNTSIGLFSRNRYGVSTQVAKYIKDNLWFTAKVGYTGHASYVRYDGSEVQKGWVYTDLNYVDYKLGIHYWLHKYNTQFSIEYGKVLFDKTALFFRCNQRFKEIDLGVYAFRTQDGSNFGLEIALPIFPKKYWKPKRFSVRPSKHFRYNYLSGVRRTGGVPLAREYQAQGMLFDFPQDLNPYFVKNYLLEIFSN